MRIPSTAQRSDSPEQSVWEGNHSTSGELRHKGDLIVVVQRHLFVVHLVLVDGDEADDAEHAGMLHADLGGDVVQGHPLRIFELHLACLYAVGDRAEEQHSYHLLSPRFHTPLLPPRFSSSCTHSMRMPRSMALHMSYMVSSATLAA